jgi:hypothetical protein
MLIDDLSLFTRTVGPAVEPVTLAEAKAALRVDGSEEDAYINTAISVAREWAEEFTNRALHTQTWVATFDSGLLTKSRYFSCPSSNRLFSLLPDSGLVELPRPPLQSVTSVTYIDSDGAEQTLSTANYTVDILSAPGRIQFTDMPNIKAVLNALKITYVAGYGDTAGTEPSRFKQAVLYMVNHFYENRLPVVQGPISSTVDMTAEWLLKDLRVRYL